MTKDINQVSIVGNLVFDPEFHEANGKEMAFMRVATGRFMSKSDRESSDEESLRRDTTIHDVRVYVDHIVSMVKNLVGFWVCRTLILRITQKACKSAFW